MANEKKINYVILGLLNHESLTGYEIKKRIDHSLKFFWSGSFGAFILLWMRWKRMAALKRKRRIQEEEK